MEICAYFFIMEQEVWKDVKGYEGLYQVSNWGRVKRITNNNRVLKPYKVKKGYLNVVLSKNGKAKTFRVHRLVALAFLPNPDSLPEINHKDEKKDNNNVDNLEWCSGYYNIQYGTRGERISKSKIDGKACKPVLQFNLDGTFVKEWKSSYQIQRILGYKNQNINSCCHGKTKWAYGFIWKFK